MTVLLVIHAGCFYYTLGNICPIFRSNLRAIQLLAVAKTSDIHTYGCEALLQPLCNKWTFSQGQAHLLEYIPIKSNDASMNVVISTGWGLSHAGWRWNLYRALCMLGDTPASNFIGGFKESVAFALRKCRWCMTTATDMSEKVSKLFLC